MIKVRMWNYHPGYPIRLATRTLQDHFTYRHDGRCARNDGDEHIYQVRKIMRRYTDFYRGRKRRSMPITNIDVLLRQFGYSVEGYEPQPSVPKFTYRWEESFAEEIGDHLTYREMYIYDVIRLSDEHDVYINRADDLRYRRAPWRMITKSNVACIIRDMGGDLL